MKCFVLTSPVGSPLFIVLHCGYSELDYFDHLALSLPGFRTSDYFVCGFKLFCVLLGLLEVNLQGRTVKSAQTTI